MNYTIQAGPQFDLKYERDEHGWLIIERQTSDWGAGETFLDAWRDFVSGEKAALEVLERGEISEHLRQKREYIRARLDALDSPIHSTG